MQEVIVTVYEFNELSEATQEKVLDNLWDINVDSSYDWWDNSICDWIERLSERGFNDAEIRFSGFGSQGDGARFTCTDVDILKFLNFQGLLYAFPGIEKSIEEGDVSATIEKCGMHYMHSHKYTVEACVEYNDNFPLVIRDKPFDPDQPQDLTRLLTEDVREQSQCIYNELRDEYFHLISDDCVKDTILANDYLFRENGAIWR